MYQKDNKEVCSVCLTVPTLDLDSPSGYKCECSDSDTSQNENKLLILSVKYCYKCDPQSVWTPAYAPTVDGIYKCESCDHVFDIPTGKYLNNYVRNVLNKVTIPANTFKNVGDTVGIEVSVPRFAQPMFDWIKKYYPQIDIRDEKQLSLYTAYHDLRMGIDKLNDKKQ